MTISRNVVKTWFFGTWFVGMLTAPSITMAVDAISESVTKQSLNPTAVSIFFAFMALTLMITYWAAKRTRSRKDFYTAGGGIPAWQNGVAIAGDFMSAATFLGITAALYGVGFDGIMFIVPVLAAWPIILFVIAERLRNLGRYTFVDVVSFRLADKPIRKVAAIASIVVVVFYLVAQVVGAGKLIQLLFGMDYLFAVIIVSVLMVVYVIFGGMLATTWVQFIKAVLLVSGCTAIGVLMLMHYDFDLSALFESAAKVHPKGSGIFLPGGLFKGGGDVLSLAVTLTLGFIGLPHVLMRLFTVKDGREARKSAFYATAIMGYVYLFIIIIGFGAISIVMFNPEFHNDGGRLIGGNNMLALHATKFLGGDILLGFMSAVTFATILAVVAGLTLAGAAAVAHDLYGQVICDGNPSEKRELQISRITVVVLGVLSIALGVAFEHQNVVFIASSALAISASVNAPVLILAMYWNTLTTRGAVAGIVVGLVSSIGLIIVGPLVMEAVLGYDEALFPYQYPAVVSAPLAFIAAYLFSISDKSNRAVMDRRKFDDQFVRSETGIGIDDVAGH